VIDAGLIVNPDGARAQAEGAITMGLSATMIEELTVSDGVISSTNFHQYPLLRMARAPEIDVAFMGKGPPEGLGNRRFIRLRPPSPMRCITWREYGSASPLTSGRISQALAPARQQFNDLRERERR
jgi:hypothetical protein